MKILEDYRKRTDNITLPNTERGWEEFCWKLHFLGGSSIRFVYYLLDQEKKARLKRDNSL